jgi:ABC-2 type transport system ATP-binding protein
LPFRTDVPDVLTNLFTLSITSLSKTYVQTLNDVTLHIDKRLFGLLGPNGAANQRSCAGSRTLRRPRHGSFRRREVTPNSRSLRSELGYLPQTFGVYPKLPAVDLLDHIAMLKGVSDRKQHAKQIDALLQLTILVRNASSTYSGERVGFLRRLKR